MARGGKREGAGRPPGIHTPKALPDGAVALLKAMRHRVPDNISPELGAIADRGLATLVGVMDGDIRILARERLSAAAMLREEICGPMAKKLEHTGSNGETLTVVVKSYADEEK